MMGGYSMMGGMSWIGMFFMGLFWIAAIALIIWGLVSLFRIQRRVAEADAHEILKRRFAQGAISREEFEQARAALQ